MGSKLLNVRMDQKMIEDLKEVCKELEINVTDAIKLFAKKLIKERQLFSEEENASAKDAIKTFNKEQSFKEVLEEISEVGDIEDFEKMNEDISNTIWSYYKNLKNFSSDLAKIAFRKVSNYDEFYYEKLREFTEKSDEELKNKIINSMAVICKKDYDAILETWEEQRQIDEEAEKKFNDEKYISIMETIKNENPALHKELVEKYSYNINNKEIFALDCRGYIEAKEKLERLLTPEEIREYINYSKQYEKCKTKIEKENLLNEIEKDEKKCQILLNACKKLRAGITKKEEKM